LLTRPPHLGWAKSSRFLLAQTLRARLPRRASAFCASKLRLDRARSPWAAGETKRERGEIAEKPTKRHPGARRSWVQRVTLVFYSSPRFPIAMAAVDSDRTSCARAGCPSKQFWYLQLNPDEIPSPLLAENHTGAPAGRTAEGGLHPCFLLDSRRLWTTELLTPKPSIRAATPRLGAQHSIGS
jgi:hypothetical protein